MLVLLLPLSALGHVRLRYNGYPIRNAPSPLTDGLFSTAGMCGGNSKWNAMGYSDSIRDGDTITLKMSYNGGHTSPANLFKAKMHCLSSSAAQPHITESMMTSAAVIPASAGASCEAVASDSRIDPPYELRCKLPAQQVQVGTTRGCTISVYDQRGWGGCIDFKLRSTTDTPSAPTAPPSVAVSVYIVFIFNILYD